LSAKSEPIFTPTGQEDHLETKKTYKSFSYTTSIAWKSGNRGAAGAAGRPDVEVSSPPEFKGEAGLWTPEDLFVASVNACTLMTFLAFAARKQLDFASYECRAEGRLEFVEGKYRFTEVKLYPQVVVKSPADVERAQEVLKSAHVNCFISNSISSAVTLSPEIHVV
jgi:organic hydroperoxide reductase OsmC/OhrA